MKIPLTIVTGALGAGKTTFVNYLLTEHHGFKIGVIVNEFGSVGIDSEILVASKEKLIELPNGCICCAVRDDLMTGAVELLDSKRIDYLVIETSGLAEVTPVAMTFTLPKFIDRVELDGIICVVDAENFEENKKHNRTATEQLECADIVLLNKVDLVGKGKISKIKKDIVKIVPSAQILETVKGRADLRLLLDVRKFDSSKQLIWKKQEHAHAHDPAIMSVNFSIGPVDSDKIQAFFDKLPKSIFRAKGVVCVKESAPGQGDELRMIFQKVGKRWEMEFSRPWNKGEKKDTRIVFIGKRLNEDKLRTSLKKCA